MNGKMATARTCRTALRATVSTPCRARAPCRPYHFCREPPTAQPQVVVAFDAGCLLEPAALDWLANTCAATRRPVQAACLPRARDGATAGERVAQWARIVEHWLRPLGWRRLGMGCTLADSGVALPWPLASTWPLANPDCALDLKLGLDFALAGSAPLFCGDAVVTSAWPDEAAMVRRTRRELRQLGLVAEYAPRLLARAIGRRDGGLLALAADLCKPPVSLLLLLTGVAGAAGALGWVASGAAMPWALPTPLAAVAMSAAWPKAGRAIVPARQLGHAAAYVVKKIPLYLRSLMRQPMRPCAPARDDA